MPKDTHQPTQSKGIYRVKNWPEYNAGLIARGNVTLWMDEALLCPTRQTPDQRGRPLIYSDRVIQMLLTLKSVYRLPLRALQGFATSLQYLGMPELLVPNYSTLSRRAKSLQVTLPVLRNPGEAVHLLVDSTGLKLFGEGEWKVRKHGYSKRRSWRKVHLALDAKTRQVCAVLMTHRNVDDASYPARAARAARATAVRHKGGYCRRRWRLRHKSCSCSHCRIWCLGVHSSRRRRSPLAKRSSRSAGAQRSD